MNDRDTADVREVLDDAARAERQTRAASRWFSRYLLLLGASGFALVVAIEALFPEGGARGYALGALVLGVAVLSWRADTHDVLFATAVWREWRRS